MNESILALEMDSLSLDHQPSSTQEDSATFGSTPDGKIDNDAADSTTKSLSDVKISPTDSARELSEQELLTTAATPDAETSTTKMAVYFHPMCSQHRIPDHPEHHSRVDGILTTLKETWGSKLLFREARQVTEDQILNFHTPALLSRFRKLADKALKAYQAKKPVYLSIDCDTTVMWNTRPAAFYAAGSVISALNSMYLPSTEQNYIDTAFCCVRPPGHHAERDKSCGFCFFNNVAIGARHAQKMHGVERVAVLDFDVHHGNGTEEGFTDDPTVFYGSTHGRDHFPGTGHDPSPNVGERAEREVDRRIVNRLLTPGPTSRSEFFVKWKEILSEMERFKPQLVIMSTGFDAHDDDPLADCELEDDDYRWITEEILASCGRVGVALGAPVRYLSVLEGGYDVPAIQRSAVCHIRAMLRGIPNNITSSTDQIATTTACAGANLNSGDCVDNSVIIGGDAVPPKEQGAESSSNTTASAVPAGVVKEDLELVALREYLEDSGITFDGQNSSSTDKSSGQI